MLTRSFLFLLAILTGVAAPAANAAQPQQAAIGSAAELVSSRLVALSARQDISRYSYAQIHDECGFTARLNSVAYFEAHQVFVTPRTYRGDRTRE